MTKKAVEAKSNLEKFKLEVDKILEDILQKEIASTARFTPDAQEYIKRLRDLTVNGGKRLRGAFVYYSYLMFGGNDTQEIMRIAAAIEILHIFLLVEDDFMDMAKYRRSEMTVNEYYRQRHKDLGYKKSSRHFGNSVAVNVGIIADHLAMQILNSANFPAKELQRAMKRVNEQIMITAHGQIHDVLNEVKQDVSEQDIINVLYWKTGIYTYDNPLQVGAILAGADEKTLQQISEYAFPGGVAFQIQDDILGSFGDERRTGKSADSDIREGKQTLLTYKAYAEANKEQKRILNKVLGDFKAKKSDVDKVRRIFVETGSFAYSKAKALELVHEAKKSLLKNAKNNWREEGVAFLEGIADYMIDRDL